MENMKTCTLCKETKPLSEFGRHRAMKDGRAYWCLECNRKKAKAYRESPAGIYTNIKGLQKFHNRKPFKITREDFVEWYNKQPKQCVYCDILEEDIHLMADYYRSESRLTIDCMDNNAGYFIGNIVLACGRCNFLKSNLLSYDEMIHYAHTYIKPKWQSLKTKLGIASDKEEP